MTVNDLHNDGNLHEQYDISCTFKQLIEYLMHQTNCASITVYDEESGHFAYYDKSDRGVNNSALMLMQRAGYDIIHTGTKHLTEFQHAPSFDYDNAVRPLDGKTYPAEGDVSYVEARARYVHRDIYDRS